jgi:hypothetical protein
MKPPRRFFRIIRQVKAAGHLTMRARQAQIPLALQWDRARTEKRPDPVGRGADFGEGGLRAVRRDETAALQELSGGDEFRVDPGCRIVRHKALLFLSEP